MKEKDSPSRRLLRLGRDIIAQNENSYTLYLDKIECGYMEYDNIFQYMINNRAAISTIRSVLIVNKKKKYGLKILKYHF